MPQRQPAPPTVTSPTLIIDPGAITANVRNLAEHTGSQIMAVVKADGYGHGAVLTARAALAGGAVSLGVTSIQEAVELREGGITAPIVSWLNPPSCDTALAHRHRIELAIPSVAFLEHVLATLSFLDDDAATPPLNIHLQADVGMAREGISPADWPALVALAAQGQAQGRVQVVGIMGHLSHAADPADPRNVQAAQQLAACRDAAVAAGLHPQICHLGATSAALHIPPTHFDLVRIGAGLVGIDPAERFTLRGAMTLAAPVIQTRRVGKGEGIGYDHTFHADADIWLALIPVGYADGVPRRSSPHSQVWIHGQRYPIVGAVSMDQIIVATGDAPLPVGATALVWGPGDHGEPTIQEWAHWCGTIPHEIVTGVGRRVERKSL